MANKNDTERQYKSDTEWQYKSDTLEHYYIQNRQKCRFEGVGLPNFIQEFAVALAKK